MKDRRSSQLFRWILICLQTLTLDNHVSARHVDHLSSRVVPTRYGSLRGFISNLSNRRLQPVEVFLGVPYAGAPEGPLRFMPPVTSPHWKGVRVADRLGPVCPQKLPVLDSESEALKKMPLGRYKYLQRLVPYLSNQSEDCLYLNIYVPTSALRNASKLAVMVYIHGESFQWNSGNPYDGRILASFGNVIVVTVNYRLGVLGFLPTVDRTARGNYGLMDQVAALHWIQDNIAEFGGDVENVTIFGQGHGAACVNMLMLSPMARGLFQRAIMQSGSATSPWAIAKDAVSHAFHMANILNCTTQDSIALVECMRLKRLRDIMAVDIQVPDHLSGFGPTVDGIVLPKDPGDIMEAAGDGLYSKYDLMFGVTRVEAFFRFSAIDERMGIDGDRRDRLLRTLIRNVYTHHLQEIFLTVVNEYMDWSRSYLQPSDILEATLDALSDATVVAPVVRAGTLHSGVTPLDSMYPLPFTPLSGKKSFFYVFGHQTEFGDYTTRLGCIGGEDMPYVFGAPLVDGLGHFVGNYTRSEVTLSEMVMTHWTNFAKFGDPNTGSHDRGDSHSDSVRGRYEKTVWPSYDPINQKYLSISMKPRVRDHYHAHRLSYWLNLIPRLHDSGFLNASLHHHRLFDHDNPTSYEGVVRRQRTSARPTSTTHSPDEEDIDRLPWRPDSEIKTPRRGSKDPLPFVPPMNSAGNQTVSISVKIEESPAKSGQENSSQDDQSLYSMPLVVTIAVGCSLLALNVIVFVAICHQREKETFEKKLQEAYFQVRRNEMEEGEKPFLVKDLSSSMMLNKFCTSKELDGGQALDLVRHSEARTHYQCLAGGTLMSGKVPKPKEDHLQAWPQHAQEMSQFGIDSHC